MFQHLLQFKLTIELQTKYLETKYLELKRKLLLTGESSNVENISEACEVLNNALKKLNEIKSFYSSILKNYLELSNELSKANVLVASTEEDLRQMLIILQIEVPDFIKEENDTQVDYFETENKENCTNDLDSSSDIDYSPRVFIHKSCIKQGS